VSERESWTAEEFLAWLDTLDSSEDEPE
jgi:hypothetical protein